MGNYLKLSTQQRIESLLELGWAHRRIAREVGVNRETVGRYALLKRADPATPITGSQGRRELKTGQTRSPVRSRRRRPTASSSRRRWRGG